MPHPDGPIPADVQVRSSANGVRYVLPRRELGVIKTIAWPTALLAGAFVVVPMLVALTSIVSAINGNGGSFQAAGSGIFAIICLSIASPVFAISLAAAIGHTEIDVAPGRVKRIERASLLRWSKSIPADSINTLAMRASDEGPSFTRNLGGIVALCGADSTKRPVAIGYPPAMLTPIAHELGDRLGVPVEIDLNARLHDDEDDAREASLDADSAPAATALTHEPRNPPVGSDATITRIDGELSIRLDKRGLLKTKGLFSFALIWNIFTLGICGFMLYAAIASGAGFGVIGMGGLFLSVFLAVGVLVMYFAIRMGTRRAIIDVVGDALLITQQTAFSEDQDTWTAAEIRSIRVGPSGTKVNDVPVLELQIRTRRPSGKMKKHGFFPERADEVLEWMAAELRAALGVPEHVGDPAPRVAP